MSLKDYIKHPKTVVQLAEELKKACDEYWTRRTLTEIELKELIYIWADSGKLLQGNDINSSVKKIIGKKRIELVMKMAEGLLEKRR